MPNTEKSAQISKPILLKGSILSSGGAGKKHLLRRIAGYEYTDDYISKLPFEHTTTDAEYKNSNYQIQIQPPGDNSERFRPKTPTNYRLKNAHFMLVCFDITEKSSFNEVGQCISEIQRYGAQDVKIILVGTKLDLVDKRVISQEDVCDFLKTEKQEQIPYIEVSSKENTNISELMNLIIQTMCPPAKPINHIAAAINPNSLFQSRELTIVKEKCINFLIELHIINDFSVSNVKKINGQVQIEIHPNNGKSLKNFTELLESNSIKPSSILDALGLSNTNRIALRSTKRPWSSNFYITIEQSAPASRPGLANT